MNLSVQHLSDEAITAFADGMLGVGPRNRASRHIDVCPECERAVAEQRAAVCALREAPAPAVPVGLLERLRAVPTTTPLNGMQSMSLAPDGSAVFPAYGTTFPGYMAQSSSFSSRPASILASSSSSSSALAASTSSSSYLAGSTMSAHLGLPRRMGRRTQQLALVTAAAAMLTMGVAASAAASTGEGHLPSFSPAGGGSVQPALFPATRRQPAQLVGAVTANSHR